MEIQYAGEVFELSDGESVLECLLRHNVKIQHSCRAGLCQSCMLRVANDNDQVNAQQASQLYQKGLNRPLVEQGYFLACQSYPKLPVSIASTQSALVEYQAVVISVENVNPDICIIKLKINNNSRPFSYRGGQFVNIWRDPQIIRSYSIASADNDDTIELHIRRYPDGRFSRWASDDLDIGETLTVQGPNGSCYYSDDCKNRPLQLFAMGTGLAPIMGVLRTALAHDHRSQIHMVVGARHSELFYLLEEIDTLARHHNNLNVSLIALEGQLPTKSNCNAFLTDYYSYCTDDEFFDVTAATFICGSESFVGKLRKRCFMIGANLSDIKADIFLQAGA